MGHLLLHCEAGHVGNVRVVCQDAVEVLQRRIASGALDEVLLYFPDPWPKKRHHKRRIVQPPFVELVADRLRPGGVFRMATDWEPYAEHMLGRERPRVGLLANAAEAHKGTELTRETDRLLRAGQLQFEYVGYIEGNELFKAKCDVVATDGFTGNVLLKTAEGLAEAFLALVRHELGATPRGRLGGAVVAPALRSLRKQIHYAETGGALLAGVDGVVQIAHGRSDGVALGNAIRGAARLAEARIHRRIAGVIGML